MLKYTLVFFSEVTVKKMMSFSKKMASRSDPLEHVPTHTSLRWLSHAEREGTRKAMLRACEEGRWPEEAGPAPPLWAILLTAQKSRVPLNPRKIEKLARALKPPISEVSTSSLKLPLDVWKAIVPHVIEHKESGGWDNLNSMQNIGVLAMLGQLKKDGVALPPVSKRVKDAMAAAEFFCYS